MKTIARIASLAASSCIFALTLLPVAAQAASELGTRSAHAGINIGIHIPPIATLRPIYQVRDVTIASADIERGYVDVPVASRFEIRANIAYEVAFRPSAAWFESASVTGLAD